MMYQVNKPMKVWFFFTSYKKVMLSINDAGKKNDMNMQKNKAGHDTQ